jgi:hypothetical protein
VLVGYEKCARAAAAAAAAAAAGGGAASLPHAHLAAILFMLRVLFYVKILGV